MAFDTTNFLEVDATIEGDFRFTNRAGTVQPADAGLSARNTQGEWCLETTGATTSSGTGPSANPAGRSAYVYVETSGPIASTVWAMKRNISFDNTGQNVFLDLVYNLNFEPLSEFYIEYAIVASPNETTDWTILETIVGTLTDLWISDTFDFSGVPSTATLWMRIRVNTDNNFTNDAAFSTWREYGVDTGASEAEGYRWRDDDGSESAASWLEAQDSGPLSRAIETNTRLRMLLDSTGDLPSAQITLQYKRDDEADSEWRDV